MQEVLRETDRLRLTFLVAFLRDQGIEPLVLDEATSSMLGGLPMLPMRLMVAEEDAPRARLLLREAGALPG